MLLIKLLFSIAEVGAYSVRNRLARAWKGDVARLERTRREKVAGAQHGEDFGAIFIEIPVRRCDSNAVVE